jgi:hypothetical protein
LVFSLTKRGGDVIKFRLRGQQPMLPFLGGVTVSDGVWTEKGSAQNVA